MTEAFFSKNFRKTLRIWKISLDTRVTGNEACDKLPSLTKSPHEHPNPRYLIYVMRLECVIFPGRMARMFSKIRENQH